jgi:hypothetical protein
VQAAANAAMALRAPEQLFARTKEHCIVRTSSFVVRSSSFD